VAKAPLYEVTSEVTTTATSSALLQSVTLDSTRVRRFEVTVVTRSSTSGAWSSRTFGLTAVLVSGTVEYALDAGGQGIDPDHTLQDQELEVIDAGSGVLEIRVLPPTSSSRVHRTSVREVTP